MEKLEHNCTGNCIFRGCPFQPTIKEGLHRWRHRYDLPQWIGDVLWIMVYLLLLLNIGLQILLMFNF